MKNSKSGVRPAVLLRVLVADSGCSTNDSLTALLSDFEGLSVFGCTQEPAKVLTLVRTVHPEVVILDLPADNTTGLKVLKQVKRLRHAPVVIALAHFELSALREATLAAGADHYLNKATECDRLQGLLHKLVQKSSPGPVA
jgi:DNA-binding NarL/FixJ family response regulator